MPEGGAPGRPPRYGGCVWGFGAASSTKTVFLARFGVSLILAVQSLVALQSAMVLLPKWKCAAASTAGALRLRPLLSLLCEGPDATGRTRGRCAAAKRLARSD
jgi:hypothetical protein